MSKINHHLKGRIRDKVKQVILIDGIPEVLYKIREQKIAVIRFNNKNYRIDMPDDLINELKKLSTIEIKVSTRTSKSFKPLLIPGLGHRTTIRAVNGNTHITIGGADETQLAERIQIIRDHLTSLSITTTERCHWVCSTDKAKSNTDYTYPHKSSELRDRKIITKSDLKDFQRQAADQLDKKEMSKKTKSLREIALKSIKEAKS